MTTPLRPSTILGFFAQLAILAAAALVGNLLLRHVDMVWIGRFLGIPGTLLILAALVYSLRKRRVVRWGNPRTHLRVHEILSWLGALFVLMHAGTDFNAVLAWLALTAMAVNVISGLTGAYLLARSRRRVAEAQAAPAGHRAEPAAGDKDRFAAALTDGLMRQWRIVHIPISLAFAALALGHIVSVLMFWEWR